MIQEHYIRIAEIINKTLKNYAKRTIFICILEKMKTKNHKTNSKESNQYCDIENKLESSCESSNEESNKEYEKKNDEANKEERSIIISSLRYKDYVHIEKENSSNNMRVYSQLNNLKFENKINSMNNMINYKRCCFQICNPIDLNCVEYIEKNKLVCIKNALTNHYISLTEKISKNKRFEYKVELSEEISMATIFTFVVKKFKENFIITEDLIKIRSYKNPELYLNMGNLDEQICCSYEERNFKLVKANKVSFLKTHSYYMIKNLGNNQYLSADDLSIESILSNKTYSNIELQDSKGQGEKCLKTLKIKSLENKITENEILFSKIENKNKNSIKNVWMIQQDHENLEKINLIHVASDQSLFCKEENVKLTTMKNKYTAFVLENKENYYYIKDSQQRMMTLELANEKFKANLIMKSDVFINKEINSQDSFNNKFEISELTTKEVKIIIEIYEISIILKDFFLFFEAWGFVFHKNEKVIFSVEYVIKNMDLLTEKITQMENLIQKLEEILALEKIQLNYVQMIIKELKIFELLINFCRNIVIKLYMNTSIEKSVINTLSKNYPEGLLYKILNLLLKLIKDNKICSELLIGESQFFNELLESFPEKIGPILREAIKNLSIFTTKIVRTENNSLFQWTKLIEYLTVENVKIQKTYIDIVAEVVVDPNDIGILPYQTTVKELLLNDRRKRKIIPKFKNLILNGYECPCVIFENDNPTKFILDNKLELVQKASEIPTGLFLSNLFVNRKKISNYANYVDYITSIIRLIRNICKDRNRNKRFKNIVEDRGLTLNHFSQVFKCNQINWSLMTAYLSLFTVIHIDQDPFLPFEKREVKCQLWININSFNFSIKTSILFKQYTDYSQIEEKHKLFDANFIPILEKFFEFFLTYDFNLEINEKNEYKDELKVSFLAILEIFFETINFGYINYFQIRIYILKIIKCCEIVLIVFPNDSLFIEKTIKGLSKILILNEKIGVVIYGLNVLKQITKDYSNDKEIKSIKNVKEICRRILKNKSQIENNFEEKEFENVNNERNILRHLSNSIKKYLLNIESKEIVEEIDEPILFFLLKQIIDNTLLYNGQSYYFLIETLEEIRLRSMKQKEFFESILFINNEAEETIYYEYSGRTSNKLLDVLKINDLVEKIVNFEENSSCLEDETQKIENINELDHLITKINRDLSIHFEENFTLFKKCQDILEKLNVHNILAKILFYIEDSGYSELINHIYFFYLQFIFSNEKNEILLSKEKFLFLFFKRYSSYRLPELIEKIFTKIPNKEEIFEQMLKEIEKKNKPNEKEIIIEIILKMLKTKLDEELLAKMKEKIIFYILVEKEFYKFLTCEIFSKGFSQLFCFIIEDSPLLMDCFLREHKRNVILEKLFSTSKLKYEEKNVYLKYFFYLFVKNNILNEQECEELIERVFLPELKYLPDTIKYLLNFGGKSLGKAISFELQAEFRNLLLENEHCVTKEFIIKEYLEYLINYKEENSCALLYFIQYFVQNYSKVNVESTRELILYIIKLAAFLEKICEEVENKECSIIVNKLQEIITAAGEQYPDLCIFEKRINYEKDEPFVRAFFYEIATFIEKNFVSIDKLFFCAGIDLTFYNKRKEYKKNDKLFFESEFICFLHKISDYISNKKLFFERISYQRIKIFFNIYREDNQKKINVSFFLEKLIEALLEKKNEKLKKSNESIHENVSQNIDDIFSIETNNSEVNEMLMNEEIYYFSECLKKEENFMGVKIKDKFKEILEIEYSTHNSMEKLIKFIENSSFDLFKVHESHKDLIVFDFFTEELLKIINKHKIYLKNGFEDEEMYIKFLTKNIEKLRPVSFDILEQLYINKLLKKEFVKFHSMIYESIVFVHKCLRCENNHSFTMFIKCHRIIALINKDCSFAKEEKKLIEIEIAQTTIYAMKEYEKKKSLFWFKIIIILFKEIIKYLNNCPELAKTLVNNEDFKLTLELWTNKCINTLLKSVNKESLELNNLTLLLFKILIKFDIKKHSEEIGCILNKLSFIELFESIKISFNFFQNKINKDEECTSNPECSKEFCNEKKKTTNDQLIVEIITNFLILIQILENLSNNYSYLKLLSEKNKQFIKNICLNCSSNEETIENNKYFRLIQRIDLKIENELPKRIYFQFSFSNAYRTTDHETFIFNHLLKQPKEKIIEELYKCSIFIEKEILDYKERTNLVKFFSPYLTKIYYFAIILVLIFAIEIAFFIQIPLIFLEFIVVFFIFLKVIEGYISIKKLKNELYLLQWETGNEVLIEKLIYKSLFTDLRFYHFFLTIIILLTTIFYDMNFILFFCALELLKLKVTRSLFKITIETFIKLYSFYIFEYLLIILGTYILWEDSQTNILFEIHKELLLEVYLLHFTFFIYDVTEFKLLKFHTNLVVLYLVLISISNALFLAEYLSLLIFYFDENKKQKYMCLICFNNFCNEIENDKRALKKHIREKHNVWNYIYFFIYLRNNNKESTNEIIKKILDNKNFNQLEIL